MRKTPKRKNQKRQYTSIGKSSKGIVLFFLMVFFAVLIYAFFTGNKSVLKLYTLHQQKSELVIEKERLKLENQQLEEEIDKLQNDPQYIEEVARKKYNFKKENEEVIIVKAE